MKPMQQATIRSFYRWATCLTIVLVMTGCATPIKLVADYDEQIDKGTTALQKEVETYLVKLESLRDAEHPEARATDRRSVHQIQRPPLDRRPDVPLVRWPADVRDRYGPRRPI